jgi:hypothetical protein
MDLGFGLTSDSWVIAGSRPRAPQWWEWLDSLEARLLRRNIPYQKPYHNPATESASAGGMIPNRPR